jgi:hypothetical protein
MVKQSIKKSIKESVQKAQTFLKSTDGQKITKAAKKAGKQFLTESGLAQKGLDQLNQTAAKYTSNNQPLDAIRQLGHMYASQYFKEPETLPDTTQPIIAPTMIKRGNNQFNKFR